jgi:hypothetical protein
VSSKIDLGIWRVAVSSLETPTAIPVFCVFFSPFESAHTPTTLQRGISLQLSIYTVWLIIESVVWSSALTLDQIFCLASAEKSHRNSLHAGSVTWALERKSDFFVWVGLFSHFQDRDPLVLIVIWYAISLVALSCMRQNNWLAILLVIMWTILCSSGRICELRNFFAWDFLEEWVAAWSCSLHGSFSIAALVFERKINWNSFRRGAVKFAQLEIICYNLLLGNCLFFFLLFWVLPLTSESVLFVCFFFSFFFVGRGGFVWFLRVKMHSPSICHLPRFQENAHGRERISCLKTRRWFFQGTSSSKF